MNVRAGKVWLFRIPTFVATILLASQIFPKYAVGAEIGQSNEEWLKTYRAERPTKTTLLEIEDIIKVRGIENELSPILIRASSVSKDDTGSFSVDDKNFTIYGDKIYKFVSRAKFPDAGSDTLHEIAQTNFLLFQYDYTGVNADATHVRYVEDKLNFGEYNKYYEIQGYFSEFHVGDQMIQRSETLNGYREVRSEVIGIIKGSSFDSRIYGDVIKIRNLISTKYDKRYFAENISFSNEISYDYWSEYLSYFVKKEIFSYSTSLSNSIGSSVVTLTSFEVDPALAPARKRLVEKRSAYRRAWAEYRQGGGIGAARPAVDAAKANALFGEAFELYRSGDTTAALTKFDAGFKLDPDNGRGHLYAAEVAEKADQFERSAKHLMAAARFLAGTPDGAKAEAILSLKE